MENEKICGRDLVFLEQLPYAIVIADQLGKIQFVNQQFEMVFGYAQSEVIDKTIEMLMPGSFHVSHERHRVGFFNNPQMRPMGKHKELSGLHKTGREIPVDIMLSPVVVNGEIQVMAVIIDISEQKELDELKRRESQTKLLIELGGAVAHEISQPLTAIMGYSQSLLKKGLQQDVDTRKQIEMIYESGKRVEKILTQMREIQQYTSKTYARDLSIIDFDACVKKA